MARLMIFFLCAFFSVGINFCHSHRILIITSSLGCRSHSIYFNSIAVELAQRGHNVTYLSNGNQLDVGAQVHQHRISQYRSIPNLFNTDIKHMFQIDQIINGLVTSFYDAAYLRKLVGEPLDPFTGAPKFDLLLLDSTFSEPLLALVHALRVPFILATPSHSVLSSAWNFNVPLPYAYYNYFGFKEPMDYFRRLLNAVTNYGFVLYLNYVLVGMEQGLVGKYVSDAPPLLEIYRNASMVFLSQDPAWQDSLPGMPFTVDLGCVQCRSSQPLPQDLAEIVVSAGEAGVIYFAFGTFVKTDWLPEVLMSKIIEALADLPQLIIWNTDYNATLPVNFRRVNWVPQQDLLAHPATRLFVNHAGLNSIQEATYHACPVLAFPFCCDTFYAANQVIKNGNGEIVDWKTVTADQLRAVVHSLINNKKYQVAADRVSRLSRDTLDTPTRTAVYWMEYVIRHKGAPHLKSNLISTNLSTFQHKLIDVLILLSLISAFFIALIYFLIISFTRVFKNLNKHFFLN